MNYSQFKTCILSCMLAFLYLGTYAQKSDSITVTSFTMLGLSNDRYFDNGEPLTGFGLQINGRNSGSSIKLLGKRRSLPQWTQVGVDFSIGSIKLTGEERGGFIQSEVSMGIRVVPLFEKLGKNLSISRWIDPYANLHLGYKFGEVAFTNAGNLYHLSGGNFSLYLKPKIGIQSFPLDKWGFFAEVNPLNPIQFSFGLTWRKIRSEKRNK